ncbi:MAG TPA: assimilatory sulfite reductase (NADPH) flavoprotein subunit [Opitutales bacterium]|nr:assimilatory sulfite reductase (NADPH) flavoprotein subunit [Opitutales bacterium]
MTPIPDNAPFTPEQTAWLNSFVPTLQATQIQWLSGFLAGWQYSGANGSSQQPMVAPALAAPAAKIPVTVLYGTESGNAEALADQARKELSKRGYKAALKDMGDIEPKELEKIENLLVIVSTWGEGDPPDRATEFYEKFMNNGSADLKNTKFSVCGLGDSSYSEFCKIGNDFDARLEALGGTRIFNRAECDVDFEPVFQKWFDDVLAELDKLTQPASAPAVQILSQPGLAPAAATWSKANPFPSELLERIVLNGTGSEKETLHLEFSLEGSGLQYLPGDSLGIKPANCPEVVDDLISATGFKGAEEVKRADGTSGTLRDILIEELDSTVLSRKVVKEYAALTKNKKLEELLADPKALHAYTEGREIVDLFANYPSDEVSPQQLTELLRLLPPRLYSIASSQAEREEEVHLTVATVRYESNGRKRKGVCSTYLADRIAVGDSIPVYIHPNNRFRLPEDPETPIIMVGPGTGIAPFRSFIEERAATGAKGKNWLFFGDQRFSYDFLYQLEWLDYLKDGVLTRMDTAFSRDTPAKVYVQHRLLEKSREIYGWLEEGAHFYVCGDMHYMAKDVDLALQEIVSKEGGLSADDAKAYVSRLTKEKRYKRDVY